MLLPTLHGLLSKEDYHKPCKYSKYYTLDHVHAHTYIDTLHTNMCVYHCQEVAMVVLLPCLHCHYLICITSISAVNITVVHYYIEYIVSMV